MKDIKLSKDISKINLDLLSSDVNVYADDIRQPMVRYQGDFDVSYNNKTAIIKENGDKNSTIIKNNIFNNIVIVNGNVTINGQKMVNNVSGQKDVELILPRFSFSNTKIPVHNEKYNDITVQINSKSGDIGIKNLKLKKLIIDTLSGDVNLENMILSELMIKTLSGDMYLNDIDSLYSHLDSKSGDIDINIINSILNYEILLKTLSGEAVQKSIETSSPIILDTKNSLEAKTLSGDIKVLFKGKK